MGATANPAKGIRIERWPAKGLRRTEAGRIALPLWVLRDGEHLGDGDLVMTHDEAAALYSQLGVLLAESSEGS
ncbi:hypothetical protein [Streptomyces sp. CC53]|uniref:hypothetical protein n=1 Tax=Streptomyces sp. CC53 TaxID=1906740 RepID=UPI00210EED34|nr:hypothetical protein [Streptomyces sp. CC53]